MWKPDRKFKSRTYISYDVLFGRYRALHTNGGFSALAAGRPDGCNRKNCYNQYRGDYSEEEMRAFWLEADRTTEARDTDTGIGFGIKLSTIRPIFKCVDVFQVYTCSEFWNYT